MVMSDQTGPFKIQVEGVEQFLFSLNRFGTLVEFLGRGTWDDVAKVYFDTEQKIFDAQGTPESFAPLSPKYAARKAILYPGKPIMQRTGELMEATTGRGATPGYAVPIKRYVRRKGQQGVTMGLNSKVGYAHQKGLGNLPVRKIIQTTAAEKIQFAKVLQLALVRIERQSFGRI